MDNSVSEDQGIIITAIFKKVGTAEFGSKQIHINPRLELHRFSTLKGRRKLFRKLLIIEGTVLWTLEKFWSSNTLLWPAYFEGLQNTKRK